MSVAGRSRRAAGQLAWTSRSAVRAVLRAGSVTELADVLGLGAWWLVAELGVRTVPLPKLVRVFGLELAGAGSSPGTVPDGGPVRAPHLSAAEERRLGVVERIGGHWPTGPGPCLRQSLVTGRILRRHHPRLRFGVVAGTTDTVFAHAWVEIDGGAGFGRLDGTVSF